MTARPSGWYDDPDDETQLRYWDGILWTERRTPKVKPGLDGSRIGTPSAYPDPAEQQQAAAPGTTVGGSRFGNPGDPYAGPGVPPAQTPPHQTYGGPGQPGPQQYAQPGWQQQVARGAFTPEGQRLSGWWRRFFAWFVDGIVVFVVGALLALPWASGWFAGYRSYWNDAMDAAASGSSQAPPVPEELAVMPVQLALAVALVYAVYEIAMVVWRGRTLGKMLTGISVRSVDAPRKLTLAEAAQRFLVKGISSIVNVIPAIGGLATIFTLVDGLWPLGDSRKQAIHDKVGKSLVVVGPPEGAPAAPPPGQYPGQYPQPPYGGMQ